MMMKMKMKTMTMIMKMTMMVTMMTTMNMYTYGLDPIEVITLQSTQLTNHDKPSSPTAVISWIGTC